MNTAMENSMDRISALPELIIHQILSYLSNFDAVQTSVLSKTWLQAWSTSSNLILNEENYLSGFQEIEDNRCIFFNFVDNTLLRYRCQNLRIDKFEISVTCVDQANVHRLLYQSIKTALDHGVKDLNITVSSTVNVPSYTLPPTFFTSANALTNLSVYQCNFPRKFASRMKFPFLKTLELCSAYINDPMLEKLFSSCPLIEKIFFIRVKGFKKFVTSNLGELKVVEIDSQNEGIDIQAAPSLRVLTYWGGLEKPCLLKVGSARNLKRLELESVIFTHNFLKEIDTKFPCLKYLKISNCGELERVNMSSHSLKHLQLDGCDRLVEAKIDAPNLLTLEYHGRTALSLSLHNTPEDLMTYINMTHHGHARPSNTWFHQLRELLKSVSQAFVSLYIWKQGVQLHAHLDSRANPLPLESFMPEINQSYSVFTAIVETMFSGSRPTVISTGWLTPSYVDFIKFLGNELIMASRNSDCCSSDQETKCWRHYLKDIEVEVYKKSQDAWQPLHWETLLVTSILLDEGIRLSLKWNAKFKCSK